MKIHKRLFVLVLSLVVVFTAGCGRLTKSFMEFYDQPRQIVMEEPQEKVDDRYVITIYSQVSDYFGQQTGWSGKLIEDRLHMKVLIVPFTVKGDTAESEFLYGNPDMIIFSSYSDAYDMAVKSGELLDLTQDRLLEEHGDYIFEHFQKNIEYNKARSGKSGVYGIAGNTSSSEGDHEDFRYTWGIRWDLYEQLGYPEVNNLKQLTDVMKQMKTICPKDEEGNETYAYSLWSDWDKDMPYCFKSMVEAYYGKLSMGMGFYDVETGEYSGCLEDDAYMDSLKFFNNLYRDGLLDPKSKELTEQEVVQKILRGSNLCSMVEYAGCVIYNSDEHISEGKMMCPLVPKDATPLVYGISEMGTGPVFSIMENSPHREKCMELMDYLFSAEGFMEMTYGPKGVTWDYDSNGNMYLTDFGTEVFQDGKTTMPDEWGKDEHFMDGLFKLGAKTWNIMAKNPDAGGEVFKKDYWLSNNRTKISDAFEDWQQYTGYRMFYDYLDHTSYKIHKISLHETGEIAAKLKQDCWNQVEQDVIEGSWKAVYSRTDEEFETNIQEMKRNAYLHGYEQCIEWGKDTAERHKEGE